jgi:hypothetical protein
MKKQGCILHKMMLGMFVLLAVGIGQAQYGVMVKIPFNFTVGTQRYSAGEYTLKPYGPYQHTVLLQTWTGQTPAFISINSVESREVPSSAKLVFHQYGARYFLAEIWNGNGIGQQLTESRAEVEMAKAANSPGQMVALSFAPQH